MDLLVLGLLGPWSSQPSDHLGGSVETMEGGEPQQKQ